MYITCGLRQRLLLKRNSAGQIVAFHARRGFRRVGAGQGPGRARSDGFASSSLCGVRKASVSCRRVLLHRLSSIPPPVCSGNVRLRLCCPHLQEYAAGAVGRRVHVGVMLVLFLLLFRTRFSFTRISPVRFLWTRTCVHVEANHAASHAGQLCPLRLLARHKLLGGH